VVRLSGQSAGQRFARRPADLVCRHCRTPVPAFGRVARSCRVGG
jgi:hypothetical protein